jgi:hypothetical protein
MNRKPDFTNDIYARTLDHLREKQKAQAADYFQVLSKESRFSFIKNEAWGLIIAPLLTFALLGAIFRLHSSELLFVSAIAASVLLSGVSGLWGEIGAGNRGRIQAALAGTIIIIVLSWKFMTSAYDLLGEQPGITFWILLIFMSWFAAGVNWFLGKWTGYLLRQSAHTGIFSIESISYLLGSFSPDLIQSAYDALHNEIDFDEDNWKSDLQYVTAAAQARLDSAEVRALPWGFLIAIASLGIVENMPVLIKSTIWGFVILLGLFGTAYTANFANLHDAILQAAAKIRRQERLSQVKLNTNKPLNTRKETSS